MDLSVKPGDLQRTRLLLLTAQEDQQELKTEGMIHHVDTNRTLHVALCQLDVEIASCVLAC